VLLLAGTAKLKLPSVLVIVPKDVPFTLTEAFGIPAPWGSVTFPETVRFCARSWVLAISTPSMMNNSLLMLNFKLKNNDRCGAASW
jgi:hypothetical protein